MPPAIHRQHPPVCEACGNTRLQKYGVHNNKQSYHCPPCRRTQAGYPVPEPKPDPGLMPCPKCRGKTRIVRAHNNGSRHQLICRRCRHNFTDLYRNSPMPRRAEGTFRHRKTFTFCHKSTAALDYLCQRKGMSPVQALRYRLHAENDLPLLTIAIARTITDPETGDREVVITHPLTALPRPPAQTRLPNAFPAALRKMREKFRAEHRKPFRDGNPPIVGLCSRVTLCMDDRAKTGLLIAMQRYNTDHQNALRQLLIDSHQRGAAIPDALR